jgi:hypothetical protein
MQRPSRQTRRIEPHPGVAGRDQQAGSGVSKGVLPLFRGEEGRDGHRHAAGRDQGQIGHHPVRAVVECHTDGAVITLEPRRQQVDLGLKVGPAQGVPGGGHDNPLRRLAGRPPDSGKHRAHGRPRK